MSSSFQGHKPKLARLGKAGLGANKAAKTVTASASASEKKPEASGAKPIVSDSSPKAKEIGGPSGPEPTRYGDWERKGICYDF